MRESLLPLFILDVVLFPGMVLPLRIFEPRYQLMIRRCIETDRRFGVVLRRQSDEGGTKDQPHRMGTIAELSGWEVLPNGHVMLVCVGVTRFRILELSDSEPYLTARVETLDDQSILPVKEPDLLTQVRTQLVQYIAILQQLSPTPIAPPETDLEAEALGYYLLATLQIDNERKQALLELHDSWVRLQQGAQSLTTELSELQAFTKRVRERGDYFYRGKRLSRN